MTHPLDSYTSKSGGRFHVHRYEEPVVLLREDWASRAPYDPDNDNPNRWWNDGRGLPERIETIC